MAVAVKGDTVEETKGQNIATTAVAAQPQEKENNDIEVHTSLGDDSLKKGKDIGIHEVTKETIYFQVVLLFVSCHYVMVFTNWGDPIINNIKTNYFAANKESFWLKISVQWVSFFFYFAANVVAHTCPGIQKYFD